MSETVKTQRKNAESIALTAFLEYNNSIGIHYGRKI